MSKSEVKPFKIRQSILYPGGNKPEGAPDFYALEVIELSAYQSLQKENEEMKDKLEQRDGTCQNLFDLWHNSMLRENELKIQVEILKEYKAMYEGLCK